jgi:hypothetical protein
LRYISLLWRLLSKIRQQYVSIRSCWLLIPCSTTLIPSAWASASAKNSRVVRSTSVCRASTEWAKFLISPNTSKCSSTFVSYSCINDSYFVKCARRIWVGIA